MKEAYYNYWLPFNERGATREEILVALENRIDSKGYATMQLHAVMTEFADSINDMPPNEFFIMTHKLEHLE